MTSAHTHKITMNTNTAILILLMSLSMTVLAEEESYAAAEVRQPSFYERFLPANWWTWDR